MRPGAGWRSMAEPALAAQPLEVVRRRLRAQRLTGAPFATPAEAVAYSGAVQAQEYAEALWSLGLRVRGATAAGVEAACDRGEILRTHVLRPTWHFVGRGRPALAAAPHRRAHPGQERRPLPSARPRRRHAAPLRGGAGTHARRRRAAHAPRAGRRARGRGNRHRRAAPPAHPAQRRARGRDRQRPAARQAPHVPARSKGARPPPRGARARRTSRSSCGATSRATAPRRCATSPGGRA